VVFHPTHSRTQSEHWVGLLLHPCRNSWVRIQQEAPSSASAGYSAVARVSTAGAVPVVGHSCKRPLSSGDWLSRDYLETLAVVGRRKRVFARWYRRRRERSRFDCWRERKSLQREEAEGTQNMAEGILGRAVGSVP
jgi:hypothetical protein